MRPLKSWILPILVALGGCATTMDYPKQWPGVDESATAACIDIAGIYREVSEPRPGLGDWCPSYGEPRYACASLLTVVTKQEVDAYTGNSGLVEVTQTPDRLVFSAHGKEVRSLTRGTDYQCNAHQIELTPVSKTIGGAIGPIGGLVVRDSATVVVTKATDRSLVARVKSTSFGMALLLVVPWPHYESKATWWRWQADTSRGRQPDRAQ